MWPGGGVSLDGKLCEWRVARVYGSMNPINHVEIGAQSARATGHAPRLQAGQKMGKVSRRSTPRLRVSINITDFEQTPATQEEAIRLFARALIHLYLQDHGQPRR